MPLLRINVIIVYVDPLDLLILSSRQTNHPLSGKVPNWVQSSNLRVLAVGYCLRGLPPYKDTPERWAFPSARKGHPWLSSLFCNLLKRRFWISVLVESAVVIAIGQYVCECAADIVNGSVKLGVGRLLKKEIARLGCGFVEEEKVLRHWKQDSTRAERPDSEKKSAVEGSDLFDNKLVDCFEKIYSAAELSMSEEREILHWSCRGEAV
ncbi:hypothetical protein Ancab_019068 [Ancistrocladus abbreviatus]